MTLAMDTPADVQRTLAGLRAMSLRPEISYPEIPAPGRLAPFSVALSGEIINGSDEELGSGRFIVLHDPDGVDEWDGEFRVVSFVRAVVEQDLASDPMMTDVGWSWLDESLRGVNYRCLGGTVTQTSSVSYADLASRVPEGIVEIRASWTPTDADLVPHAEAWAQLLAQACGLPPLPPGVAHIRPGGR